ncbi:MAG: hypothetical protein NTY22_01310, partial [Proteobacteria bacterium]|nr:hypothetical protein [Pseudomonadota bacterium]
MYLTIILINLILGSLFAQNELVVLDDATQPNRMSRWAAEGPVGPAIGIDYINNDKERGTVIRFRGFALNSIFTYRGDNGEPLNIANCKALQWKMKSERPFLIQVKVSTDGGIKYLLYSDLTNKVNSRDTYLHIGIGSIYRDGKWKIITRDIEKDLLSFLPKAKLISIDAISFRGTGYIDDLLAFSSVPKDILLNKGSIKGWDKIGKSGKIGLDSDPILEKIVKFDSGKDKTDFRLRNSDGTYWKIRTNVILQWKIKTDQPYKVFVIGDTLQGKYILSYESTDANVDYDKTSEIISYGLGKDTLDGKWHAITRNIEQ